MTKGGSEVGGASWPVVLVSSELLHDGDQGPRRSRGVKDREEVTRRTKGVRERTMVEMGALTVVQQEYREKARRFCEQASNQNSSESRRAAGPGTVYRRWCLVAVCRLSASDNSAKGHGPHRPILIPSRVSGWTSVHAFLAYMQRRGSCWCGSYVCIQ